jgi:multidrug efflux pump subunit AcrA (membrane-fusion protein)
VRVTQPVVCNVCDYEEYTGKIETGSVAIRLPTPGRFEKTYFDLGATIREGDLLGEFVPYSDPKIQQAQEAVRLAMLARVNAVDSDDRAKAAAQVNAAEDELERVISNAPRVKVFAPVAGKLGGAGGGFGGMGGRGGRGGRGGAPIAAHLGSILPQDAMLVTFDVDERAVLAHRRMTNRKPDWELSLPVACALADDKGFPYRGKVVSVAEGIDASTHTQRWQAVVPNKDGIFLPGMSVRLRLITGEPHKVLAIPWNAGIEYVPDHENDPVPVKIVNNRNVIETRMVTFWRGFDIRPGMVTFRGQIDGLLGVVEGLNVNDWVVLRDEGNVIVPWLRVGSAVTPEKVTTPPPPLATPADGAPASPSGGSPREKPSATASDASPGVAHFEGTIPEPPVRAAVAESTAPPRVATIRPVIQSTPVYLETKGKIVAEKEAPAKAGTPTPGPEKLLQFDIDRATFARMVQAAQKRPARPAAGDDPFDALDGGPPRARAPLRGKPAPKSSGINWVSIVRIDYGYEAADEKDYPHHAEVKSLADHFDPNLASVPCTAKVAKTDALGVPGTSVRVRLDTGTKHDNLAVLQQAVFSDQGKEFVCVVNEHNVVDRRAVNAGHPERGFRAITGGLSRGDTVIADPSAVKPGMAVKPDFMAGILQSPTPPIEFGETPLKDVVEYLKDFLHIQIQIDKKSLDAAGIDPDVAITANVRDMSFASALRLTLRDVGLTYVAEDEYILITAPTKEPGSKLPNAVPEKR